MTKRSIASWTGSVNCMTRMFNSATNKKGESIRLWTQKQIEAYRLKGTNIGTKFWCDLNAEFALDYKGISDELPDPPEDLEVGKILWKQIGICHDTNPTIQSCRPFEDYLEFCDILNEKEIFGIANAMQVSPRLSKHIANGMQIALLKYFVRTCYSCCSSLVIVFKQSLK